MQNHFYFKNKILIFFVGILSTFFTYIVFLYLREPYFSLILTFLIVLYLDNLFFSIGWFLGGTLLFLFGFFDGNFSAILVGVPLIDISARYIKKEKNTFRKIIIFILFLVGILLIFYIFVVLNLNISNLLKIPKFSAGAGI